LPRRDDDRRLNPQLHDVGELAREQGRRLRRDAVPGVRGSERVSRELEEDPPIDRASPLRLLSHRSRLSVELLAKLVPDEPPDGNFSPTLAETSSTIVLIDFESSLTNFWSSSTLSR
jgi:hypothetical protein